MTQLLKINENGLYCEQADAYVDPWRPVTRAIITHAHGDHARWGSNSYLCAKRGARILQIRMGKEAKIESAEWGQTVNINEVKVSFHPAGHILGSAQIRLEYKGEVVVVSGDYKIEADTSCDAFEPIKCSTFVTESTFGLPIYRWQNDSETFDSIHNWWRRNVEDGVTSILLSYALGKSQRILSKLDGSIGPVAAHGTVINLNGAYQAEGIELVSCEHVCAENVDRLRGKALIIAPPSIQNTSWLRKLAPYSSAFASGWMLVRGQRRRRGVDRGFVISDHADWPGLQEAVKATEAENIWVTHGYTHQFVQWLKNAGYNACELKTQFDSGLDDSVDEQL